VKSSPNQSQACSQQFTQSVIDHSTLHGSSTSGSQSRDGLFVPLTRSNTSSTLINSCRSRASRLINSMVASISSLRRPDSPVSALIIGPKEVDMFEIPDMLPNYDQAIDYWEAQEFLRELTRRDWPDCEDMIRFECSMTLKELRNVGRMSKEEGTRTCQDFVRAPVIWEKVAESLWERLREEAEAHPEDKDQKADDKLLDGSSKRRRCWRMVWKVRRSKEDDKPAAEKDITTGCPFCPNRCTMYVPRYPASIHGDKPSSLKDWALARIKCISERVLPYKVTMASRSSQTL